MKCFIIGYVDRKEVSMEELFRENAKLLYNYLCSICHDESLAEELTQELFVTEISAERQALSHMELLDTLKHLHTLPEDMREVIYLRSFGDLSFREIGDIMGKSENWARVTYFRGKEKLPFGMQAAEIGPFLAVQLLAFTICFILAFIVTLVISLRKKSI